jgi:predicted transcriptional regulator of viral defense system
MTPRGGLGSQSREKLAAVLRDTQGTISPSQAASALELSKQRAAQLLAFWASRGWLSRVQRGLYVPIRLESKTSEGPLEDPWVVATALFSPCYVGGWSAAEHWGLTEQIFRSVLIVTTKKPRQRKRVLKGTSFILRSVGNEAMFGLKPVWRTGMRVQVSDPARTIIDMLSDPTLAGGIRPAADMLTMLLKEFPKDADRLIEYAKRLGNGATFKRLGFLLETLKLDRPLLVGACRKLLTSGYVKLDPALPSQHLMTAWRLWVPTAWKPEGANG